MMTTETIKRDNGYNWFVYSRYGSPLRDIIAKGVRKTKIEADEAANEALHHALSIGLK